MIAPRNVRIVIEEMLDHLEYVLAKAQNLSPTEFRADRDIRQSVERSARNHFRSQPPLAGRAKGDQAGDFLAQSRGLWQCLAPCILWRELRHCVADRKGRPRAAARRTLVNAPQSGLLISLRRLAHVA